MLGPVFRMMENGVRLPRSAATSLFFLRGNNSAGPPSRIALYQSILYAAAASFARRYSMPGQMN